MKLSLVTLLAYSTSIITAAPQIERDVNSLSDSFAAVENFIALEKRKGGGGGGGGKGGGGSSGGSSGGKGGSSSGSGSTGSSGSGGSRSPGSTSSNTGGRTTTGSGTTPAYGNRYAGGASVPYKAGGNAPTRNIAPYVIGGAAVGGFGGYYARPWIYPVYAYPYPIGYGWYGNDGRNHTTNVTCLCQSDQTCGCDPTDDKAFLAQILTNSTNGTGAPVNTSIVSTAIFPNGSAQTYINGSLQNGTTAAGGTVSPNAASIRMMSYAGYGVMAVTVVASVFVL